jgi:hypothetical protein
MKKFPRIDGWNKCASKSVKKALIFKKRRSIHRVLIDDLITKRYRGAV